MAIYVQFGKNNDIKGNVSAKGHESWIECNSFQFGVGRAVPMVVGKGTDRECSNPSLSEITLTKTMEDSSPYLFQEALTGTGKQVTIHLTKTGAESLETVVEYILSDAILCGYSVSSGGDVPAESLSLAYTKIEMKYFQSNKKGKTTSQIPVGYDLGTAKKL